MAVYRKRSTMSAPDSLSISYLIGSPPTGTSTITFTSFGGSLPMDTDSRRIQFPSGDDQTNENGVFARGARRGAEAQRVSGTAAREAQRAQVGRVSGLYQECGPHGLHKSGGGAGDRRGRAARRAQ